MTDARRTLHDTPPSTGRNGGTGSTRTHPPFAVLGGTSGPLGTCGNAQPVKTSRRPRRGRFRSTRTRSIPRPTSATVTRFPVQHVAQRPSKLARTEPLCRQRRLHRERRVATRTPARTIGTIRKNCPWALALARFGCPGRSRYARLDLGQFGQFRQHGQGNPPTITPRLFPSATLARRARPPRPARLTATPTRGRPAARGAAVTTLGLDRPIELLAALEQATTAQESPRGSQRLLRRPADHGILKEAQGRYRSRRSRLGASCRSHRDTLSTHRTIHITGRAIDQPRREGAVGGSRRDRDQPIAAKVGHCRESGKVADRD